MAMHISLAKDMEPPTLQLLQARPKLLFSSFSAFQDPNISIFR
jgi:hypothetical protein